MEEIIQELFTTAALTSDDKNPKGCFIAIALTVVLIVVWGLISYYK